MGYRFIDENQKLFGLRWLLNHMGIRANAYYNYLQHKKREYQAQKDQVCKEIKAIYRELNEVLVIAQCVFFLQGEAYI